MITSASEHIRVAGHTGTWYVIDESWAQLTPDEDGQPRTIRAHVFLLEHETYGDEAASVIIDEDGALLLEDVYNGFDDLEDAGWEIINEAEYQSGREQCRGRARYALWRELQPPRASREI